MKPATLFLLAALLCCGAGQLRAQFGRGAGRSDLMGYIQGEGADPACGVCLKAAQKFFDEKKKAELATKTAGLALIPAGVYRVGSPETIGDPDERPAADITLDAFYMDKTEVTLKDYMQFAQTTSANYPEWAVPNGKFNMQTGKDNYYKRLKTLTATCPSCAVFGVTWSNARAYCAWKKRRLPTEAEWEAAARAGSAEAYSFGDIPTAAGPYAWYVDNSKNMPHAVGQKKPNKLGLHDMHGNVWEWVSDVYEKTYYAGRPARNPTGPASGKERVIRGGSWAGEVDATRSGNRASSKDANDDIGFRCVISEADLEQQRGNGF